MERLTTDAPETNWHVLMNYAYAKDGEVRLTYGERSEDVALADYISSCAKEFLGCNVLREDVLNGDSCAVCDCPLSVLNAVATQAATLRAKVKKYEDLEEQGRLVVLPCKVGDTVWGVVYDTRDCPNCVGIGGCFGCSKANPIDVYRTDFKLHMVEKIGRTLFLTREEAEAAMKGVSEDG